MKTVLYPNKLDWPELTKRPVEDHTALSSKVRKILDEVKLNGDRALRKYSSEFDRVKLEEIEVNPGEINQAAQSVFLGLRDAIQTAASNIRRFHEQQKLKTEKIDTMQGITCWRKSVPIDKVGFYIPGGTAPLFSTVLMLGIPAQIAGCREIILATPPTVSSNGVVGVHPAILFAAQLVGVTRIFKIGGAQAIAAMAYGTESIPPAYKIFGPGNQYVNCAKQLVQMDGVAIDMPAGPSEVCVMADNTCQPRFVAADILSQAEHGRDSQVLLICNDPEIAKNVLAEVEKQLQDLPRKNMALDAINNSHAVVLKTTDEMIALANAFAPEHLIIAMEYAEKIADEITNAGSVFLGNYSPESAGDYASGTNHVLPTNLFARAYSGVSVDSFVKKITYQQITKDGLMRIGGAVELMAAAEGLDAHKNAISIRLKTDS